MAYGPFGMMADRSLQLADLKMRQEQNALARALQQAQLDRFQQEGTREQQTIGANNALVGLQDFALPDRSGPNKGQAPGLATALSDASAYIHDIASQYPQAGIDYNKALDNFTQQYREINPQEFGSLPGDQPSSVREWEYYSSLPPEDQARYLSMKRADKYLDLGGEFVQPTPGRPGQVSATFEKTLSPGEQPAVKAKQAEATETGKGMGAKNMDLYETATGAIAQIEDIDRLIDHIQSSEAITGMGADILKNIERAKAAIGGDASKVADTELLDVMMGSEVFPMMRALGVGARGMDTPAEREFMRSVLTGSIQLNKETLLKMAQIRRNVAQRAIDRWNRRTESGELDRFYEATGLQKQRLGGAKPAGDKPKNANDYMKKWGN